jgi:hypothetical protein
VDSTVQGIVGVVVGILILVIFIWTLVSIVTNPNHGFFGKFIWIIVVFFLSLLGSILWVLFGRGRVRR